MPRLCEIILAVTVCAMLCMLASGELQQSTALLSGDAASGQQLDETQRPQESQGNTLREWPRPIEQLLRNELPLHSSSLIEPQTVEVTHPSRSTLTNFTPESKQQRESAGAMIVLYTLVLPAIIMIYIGVFGLEWTLKPILLPPLHKRTKLPIVLYVNDLGDACDEESLERQRYVLFKNRMASFSIPNYCSTHSAEWSSTSGPKCQQCHMALSDSSADDLRDAQAMQGLYQALSLDNHNESSASLLGTRRYKGLCSGHGASVMDPIISSYLKNEREDLLGSGLDNNDRRIRKNVYLHNDPVSCIREPSLFTIGIRGIKVQLQGIAAAE